MNFTFGVRAKDVEEAAPWVVRATGLVAVARESSDKGGDYYSFDGPDHSEMWLVRNRDVYDDEPVVSGADEWEIAILIQGAEENAFVVRALLDDPEHFVFAMKRPGLYRTADITE